MELALSFWDNMAKHYPHYNDVSMSDDVQHVLEWCASKGIAFNHMSILDIGCGTGTVAIPLALKGAKVTAIDVSMGMLDILKEDAASLNLEHPIKTHQSDWETFNVPQTYDIVMASMTPAISNESHIDKMLDATHAMGIYIGWGSYRRNHLVDALTLAHQVPEKSLSGGCVKAAQFMNILKERSISFEFDYFKTAWKDAYTYEDALEYACDQLKRKEIIPNIQKVEAILHDFMENDTVIIETEAEKGIVLFSTCNAIKQYGCCPKSY